MLRLFVRPLNIKQKNLQYHDWPYCLPSENVYYFVRFTERIALIIFFCQRLTQPCNNDVFKEKKNFVSLFTFYFHKRTL
jgi:hypothetical protein